MSVPLEEASTPNRLLGVGEPCAYQLALSVIPLDVESAPTGECVAKGPGGFEPPTYGL